MNATMRYCILCGIILSMIQFTDSEQTRFHDHDGILIRKLNEYTFYGSDLLVRMQGAAKSLEVEMNFPNDDDSNKRMMRGTAKSFSHKSSFFPGLNDRGETGKGKATKQFGSHKSPFFSGRSGKGKGKRKSKRKSFCSDNTTDHDPCSSGVRRNKGRCEKTKHGKKSSGVGKGKGKSKRKSFCSDTTHGEPSVSPSFTSSTRSLPPSIVGVVQLPSESPTTSGSSSKKGLPEAPSPVPTDYPSSGPSQLGFILSDCSSYAFLWLGDLSQTCRRDPHYYRSYIECECKDAQERVDSGEIKHCGSSNRCPKNCEVCELCLSSFVTCPS